MEGGGERRLSRIQSLRDQAGRFLEAKSIVSDIGAGKIVTRGGRKSGTIVDLACKDVNLLTLL